MKKIFTLFLLVLCISLLNACSKDNGSIGQSPFLHVAGKDGHDGQFFVNYGIDTTNLRTKYYYQINNDTIEFTGIKNGHLWFAEYRKSSKQKLYEWKDDEKTDNPLKVYAGYGKYEFLTIGQFKPFFYKKTAEGSIVKIIFEINSNYYLSQCIFTSNGKSLHRTILDIHKVYYLDDWYGNYVRMKITDDIDFQSSQVIYDENGDSVFSLKGNIPTVEHLISVSQYINNFISNDSILNIERNDLLKNNIIWHKSIPLGFLLPQSAKVSYTIQKQDNIWTYNYTFLFYDGTKKSFQFSIDVNTGIYNMGETY